jgi:hypothetical protein
MRTARHRHRTDFPAEGQLSWYPRSITIAPSWRPWKRDRTALGRCRAMLERNRQPGQTATPRRPELSTQDALLVPSSKRGRIEPCPHARRRAAPSREDNALALDRQRSPSQGCVCQFRRASTEGARIVARTSGRIRGSQRIQGGRALAHAPTRAETSRQMLFSNTITVQI